MKALKVTSLHEVVAAFSFFKLKPGIFPPIQNKSNCLLEGFRNCEIWFELDRSNQPHLLEHAQADFACGLDRGLELLMGSKYRLGSKEI
jgi:hypothetical protein